MPGADRSRCVRHYLRDVPTHPWQALVEAALWAKPAFPHQRTRLPVAGRLPAGVERDDPLPPHPRPPFQPPGAAFRYALARMRTRTRTRSGNDTAQRIEYRPDLVDGRQARARAA
ncbi:hypothetical protein CTZ27_29050 [Streptomyces griseocarneus]|nr:hypothetical protein CTZ27_29050 [Streptomyces griseocarneus]